MKTADNESDDDDDFLGDEEEYGELDEHGNIVNVDKEELRRTREHLCSTATGRLDFRRKSLCSRSINTMGSPRAHTGDCRLDPI